MLYKTGKADSLSILVSSSTAENANSTKQFYLCLLQLLTEGRLLIGGGVLSVK